MRREISCEGDRGKATRVANRFDAVCEVTDDHFAGAKLRLVVDREGYWTFYRWDGDKMVRTIVGSLSEGWADYVED